MQEVLEIIKTTLGVPGGLQALMVLAAFALAAFAIYAVLKVSKERP